MIFIADIINLVKKIAVAAVQSEKPVELYTKSITGVSPLEVKLNDKTTLKGLQLTSLIQGLELGDTVCLARVQGGQKYIILGRCCDDS